jgi:hypothetical protein
MNKEHGQQRSGLWQFKANLKAQFNQHCFKSCWSISP